MHDVPLIRVAQDSADTSPYGAILGGWVMGETETPCGNFVALDEACKPKEFDQ